MDLKRLHRDLGVWREDEVAFGYQRRRLAQARRQHRMANPDEAGQLRLQAAETRRQLRWARNAEVMARPR